MPTYYHVTPTADLPRILRDGLQPRRGPRSAACGEPAPAIFLFAELAAIDAAIGSPWFPAAFDPAEPLALLAVQIPDTVPLETPVAYERVAFVPLPPAALSVLTPDLWNEVGVRHLARST